MGRQTDDGTHEGFVELELEGPWIGQDASYARFDEVTGTWWTSTWAHGRPATTGRYRASCDGYESGTPKHGHWHGPVVTLVVDDADGEPSESQADDLLAGWSDHVRASDALLHVTAADRAVRAAGAELHSTGRQARTAGRTWDEIGRALGVTRQTAWERFRAVDDEAHG